MATGETSRGPNVSRRELLRGVGGAGVAAVGLSLSAAGSTWANDNAGGLRTVVADYEGDQVFLATRPFTSVAIPEGARFAVCLIAGGGSQGAGPQPAIATIDRAHVSGMTTLTRDRGVERNVYRMLPGLDTVRPAELFGLSTLVGSAVEAGQTLEVTWEATLRGDSPPGDVETYLAHYHACVLGLIGANGTFRGHLGFFEISRRLEEAGPELERGREEA